MLFPTDSPSSTDLLEKGVESLCFLPNGQVLAWHKKLTHRYIWLLTGILMGHVKGGQWVEMTMES